MGVEGCQGWGWGGRSGCRSFFCLGGGIWPGTEEAVVHSKFPVGISALSDIRADAEEREVYRIHHKNVYMEAAVLEQN